VGDVAREGGWLSLRRMLAIAPSGNMEDIVLPSEEKNSLPCFPGPEGGNSLVGELVTELEGVVLERPSSKLGTGRFCLLLEEESFAASSSASSKFRVSGRFRVAMYARQHQHDCVTER
jgi:hypothetical protein